MGADNRFTNHLSSAESEGLAILAEECGEVIQVIGKILRHGYDSTHPNGGLSNRQLLEAELGDIRMVQNLLCKEGHLDKLNIEAFSVQKEKSVRKYLHHIKI
jgi:NTP pyrophosphatase (non-canonical NTP hydrolase)